VQEEAQAALVKAQGFLPALDESEEEMEGLQRNAQEVEE
jgi:hypothetical protein